MRIFALIFSFFMVLPNFVAASQKGAKGNADSDLATCADYLGHLVEFDSATYQAKGLTSNGVETIREAILDLRELHQTYNSIFMNMGGFVQAVFLNVLTGQNMSIYSPDGGAGKSASIHFLFPREVLFTLQLNEFSTEAKVFGGATQKGLEDGTNAINRENSIITKPYFLLDEMPNANPALLSALLAYLNPDERGYYEDGELKRAEKARAGFSTGNATPYQVLEHFKSLNMASGPAFLNRFAFKARLSNWANEDAMAKITAWKRRNEKLKSIAKSGSPEDRKNALLELKKTESRVVNFDALRVFAENYFEGSENYYMGLNTLAQKLHDKYALLMRDTETAYLADPNSPDSNRPLIPPADWSIRSTAGLLDKIIRYSAAIDYMFYGDIEKILKFQKPIELGPLSLWRAHFMATTIHSGEPPEFIIQDLQVAFNIEQTANGILKRLSEEDLKKNSTSKLQTVEIEHDILIQNTFNEILKDTLEKLKANSNQIAQIMAATNIVNFNSLKIEDFEMEMRHLKELAGKNLKP